MKDVIKYILVCLGATLIMVGAQASKDGKLLTIALGFMLLLFGFALHEHVSIPNKKQRKKQVYNEEEHFVYWNMHNNHKK